MFTVGLALLTGTALSPVGSWKYDTSTLKITLHQAARKQMDSAGPRTQADLEQHKKQLAGLLQQLKLSFGANHKFLVTATVGGKKQNVTGVWKMSGRTILVKLDKSGVKPPVLNMEPPGKRIHVEFDDPEFGKSTVYMVRTK